LTDRPDIVPLLLKNVRSNLSICEARLVTDTDTAAPGKTMVNVCPLLWGDMEAIAATQPPFERIFATDVIFAMEWLQPFIDTLIALSKPGTQVFIGHELRDQQVLAEFQRLLDATGLFSDCRKVPTGKCDPQWTHECIALFRFRRLAAKNDTGRGINSITNL
jgi:predicted nicotinamide N-methyase